MRSKRRRRIVIRRMWASKTKIHAINVGDDGISNTEEGLQGPIPNLDVKKGVEDKDAKANRKETGCRKILFSNFADDFGISGVQVIVGRAVVPLRRLLWIVVLLAGMGVMTYQIAERVAYFASFPSHVSVKLHYVDHLTFPAVAICNFNMFGYTATENSNLTHLLYDIYANSEAMHVIDFDAYDINATASEEFYISHAHALSEMILEPTWKKTSIDRDAFQTILTDFGVCYAFNTGDDNYGIREVDDTGKTFGLGMLLDTYHWNYNVGPESGVGFQLMLYPQGDVPLVTDLGFAIAVGEEVRIGVEVTRITNLAPPHGTCGEKHLSYYQRYSKNACRMECKTHFMVRSCGCKLFYMPGNATVCNLKESHICGQKALDAFVNAQSLYPHRGTVVNASSSCDCPDPCSRVIYKPNLSHAKFPSDAYAEFLQYIIGLPLSYLSDNIAKVDIFFQELSINEVEQQKAYDIFGLLCDIGGALGLWLGGSVLTVMEIIDICFKGCCSRTWH
ncbi:acid-sensing ion channel 2-like [Ptychodera flava]|uniref:acid-sensing ion channel 2-like n=1 Tax=Ptychodera flava TaxID=63121 RepID=UPI00396A5592